MTAALEGGEWSAARPGRTLPPGKTRYPFYRRLGGPQGRSGRAENLVPTGIRSRTIQPVAQSLYRLSYPAHFIKEGNFMKSSYTTSKALSAELNPICHLLALLGAHHILHFSRVRVNAFCCASFTFVFQCNSGYLFLRALFGGQSTWSSWRGVKDACWWNGRQCACSTKHEAMNILPTQSMFFERGMALSGPSDVSLAAATPCRLQLWTVL